jgi:hypothetical protein
MFLFFKWPFTKQHNKGWLLYLIKLYSTEHIGENNYEEKL